MMYEIINNYIIFLAKTVTVVVAILAVIASTVALKKKAKNEEISIEKVSRSKLKICLLKQIEDKDSLKKFLKKEKENKKKEKKQNIQKRMFIVDFIGDMRASSAKELSKEITAILTIANKNDEVMVKIQSPGGCVHDYGYAASQLIRIKNAGIKLTVCVDKMAASGGYLMASVADTIIAAPFAVIGSIGVILQLPNFNKFLKEKNISFEQITAGNHKRNLTIFGENTNEDRAEAKDQVNEIHFLFKQFVQEYRPNIKIDEVATGKTWHALDAIKHGLVDGINTSDDFIIESAKSFAVFEVKQPNNKSKLNKILAKGASVLHSFTIDKM